MLKQIYKRTGKLAFSVGGRKVNPKHPPTEYICVSIDKITLPCCHSSTSLQNCTVADGPGKAGVRAPAKVDSKYGSVVP